MSETKYMKEQAQFLAKCYKILFWLVILGNAANLLTNENIAAELPVLYWPGQILTFLFSLAYGWVLLRLVAENRRYRMAGICRIVAAVVSLFAESFSNLSVAAAVMGLLLSITALGISLAGGYQEYQGHSEVVSEADTVLSEKWLKLWKWYVIMVVVMAAGMLLIFLSVTLGVLAILFAVIAALVISVLELVYLYRQAKLFESITGRIDG